MKVSMTRCFAILVQASTRSAGRAPVRTGRPPPLPPPPPPREGRLQVHRLPDGACLDVLRFKVSRTWVGPTPRRFVQQDTGQPGVRAAARRFRQELDAVDVLERLPVPAIDLAPLAR